MSNAEREKLEEELLVLRKQLEEFRVQLAGVAQGGTKHQRAREYWKGRIQQAETRIAQIEAKLKGR